MRASPLTAVPLPTGADQSFTDADFKVIAKRAHEDFGLFLPASKKDLVYSRLVKRLRTLGLADFRSYCALMKSPAGADERMQMLSALTTNVTQFFREEHHFRMLRETVLPPLIARARSGGRVRLWSAGCSAGQEPYSLAFTVLEMFPDAARHDLRILASDVDPVILRRAEAGVYPREELKAIPDPIRTRIADLSDAGNGTFRVGDKARGLISFAELNLMSEWPMRGPFDIIFCRNVAIYFDKDTQARLWNRFANLLTGDGHLFIGHSERLNGPAEQLFRSVGVTAYARTGPAGPPDDPNIRTDAE